MPTVTLTNTMGDVKSFDTTDSAVQLNLFKVTTIQGQQIGIQKFRIGSGEGEEVSKMGMPGIGVHVFFHLLQKEGSRHLTCHWTLSICLFHVFGSVVF